MNSLVHFDVKNTRLNFLTAAQLTLPWVAELNCFDNLAYLVNFSLTLSDPSTYIYVSYLTAVATHVRKYTYSKFHL